MKLLIVLLLIALTAAQNKDSTDKPEAVTTPRPSAGTSTPAAPATKASTTTESPPPTKGTTLPPPVTNGTTIPPPTPAPTTPPPLPPTNGTTVAPTPTPTPTPTPKPAPKEFYWNVTNQDGVNCILAKADITLKLSYTNGSKVETAEFNVPSNANASGECGSLTQVLELSFGNSSTISFTFSRLNVTSEYRVSEINSTVSLGTDKKFEISMGSKPSHWFNVHANTSYECSWSLPATLEENDDQKNTTKAEMQVEMRNVRLDAFRTDAGNGFSKADACAVDTPDIVPIMVGIALGILVAVVLIAYLVGRRTTRAQGYHSM